MGHFTLDLKHLDIDSSGLILEIGSENGGGSTEKLYRYAESKDMDFITVDFNPEVTEKLPKYVNSYNCTGQDFLKAILPEMGCQVSFAYLDNFDYIFPGMQGFVVDRQQRRYGKLGVALDNEASAQCHLEQAFLCHTYRTPVFYMLIDDTYRRTIDGDYRGKGSRVVPWALEQGYEVVESALVGCPPWDGYVLLKIGGV